MEKEKEEFWDKYHNQLIEIASDFDFDDWLAMYDDDEDLAEAELDNSGKHKALSLLHMYDIEYLNSLIEDLNESRKINKLYTSINEFKKYSLNENKLNTHIDERRLMAVNKLKTIIKDRFDLETFDIKEFSFGVKSEDNDIIDKIYNYFNNSYNLVVVNIVYHPHKAVTFYVKEENVYNFI